MKKHTKHLDSDTLTFFRQKIIAHFVFRRVYFVILSANGQNLRRILLLLFIQVYSRVFGKLKPMFER